MQNKKNARIGISGGTFDPIHHGHLIIAEDVREKFNLDKVVFIPTGIPPHKLNLKVTPPEHRYNMVCSAISTNPHFEVSRIEIERPGYTYTVDTIFQLKNMLEPESRIFFITGADVIPELLTWKSYEQVFNLCEFIAVLRPGYRKGELISKTEYLREKYKAAIHIVEAPLIGISSTGIRERIREKRTIKYLVPEAVEKYILNNNLYLE
jgi:nicotinate-nucleotide adenylyltransferase